MPAYYMSRAKIHDMTRYQEYLKLVPPILESYGGKIIARGGKYKIIEGPETFDRFIIIEFSTLEQGVACFTSPEYQHAASFRRSGAGTIESAIVEGV